MLNQVSPHVNIDGKWMNAETQIDFISPPIYEVIRVIRGTPLFISEHYDRLVESAKLLNIELPLSQEVLIESIEHLVKHTGIENNNIRLEVGRVENGHISWVLFWVLSVYPDKKLFEKGVKTVTYRATRENPHAKIFRSDFAQKISDLRQTYDAFEVLLVKEDGVVTEGSRSNLFFIKEGKIHSAREEDVLKGITRMKLIEVMKSANIEWLETDIMIEDLSMYEACFITGTSNHLLPVSSIDQIKYDSANHPLLRVLQSAFESVVNADLNNTMRRNI